jgi:hypothetical protein
VNRFAAPFNRASISQFLPVNLFFRANFEPPFSLAGDPGKRGRPPGFAAVCAASGFCAVV